MRRAQSGQSLCKTTSKQTVCWWSTWPAIGHIIYTRVSAVGESGPRQWLISCVGRAWDVHQLRHWPHVSNAVSVCLIYRLCHRGSSASSACQSPCVRHAKSLCPSRNGCHPSCHMAVSRLFGCVVFSVVLHCRLLRSFTLSSLA